MNDIWYYDADTGARVSSTPGPYLPLWQYSSGASQLFANYDLLTLGWMTPLILQLQSQGNVVYSPVLSRDSIFVQLQNETNGATSLSTMQSQKAEPESVVLAGIFDDANNNILVGVVGGVLPWKNLLWRLVPADGLLAVVQNSCGQAYTYALTTGNEVRGGVGVQDDLHSLLVVLSLTLTLTHAHSPTISPPLLDLETCTILGSTTLALKSASQTQPPAAATMTFVLTRLSFTRLKSTWTTLRPTFQSFTQSRLLPFLFWC